MSTQTLEKKRESTTEVVTSWSRDSHPPSPLDRLAMRVGLALILWSRHDDRARLGRDDARELLARRNSIERERQAREDAWRAAVHTLPPR